jgi:hypothetical protein
MPVAYAYCSAISILIGCFDFRSDSYVFKNTTSGKLLKRKKLDVANPIPIFNDLERIYISFVLVGVEVFVL